MPISYILARDVLAKLLTGALRMSDFRWHPYVFATPWQMAEIDAVRDIELRAELSRSFMLIDIGSTPAADALQALRRADISAAFSADWLFRTTYDTMKSLDWNHRNLELDVVLVEIAIRNDFTVVTEDPKWASVVASNGGRTTDLKDLLVEAEADLAMVR